MYFLNYYWLKGFYLSLIILKDFFCCLNIGENDLRF